MTAASVGGGSGRLSMAHRRTGQTFEFLLLPGKVEDYGGTADSWISNLWVSNAYLCRTWKLDKATTMLLPAEMIKLR